MLLANSPALAAGSAAAEVEPLEALGCAPACGQSGGRRPRRSPYVPGCASRPALRRLAFAALLGVGCASFPMVTRPPLAPPVNAAFIEGSDATRLFVAIEGDGARGVVWFVLGPEIASSPLYPRFTSALREAGFATAALHSRGTGYSDGPRGDIDDFSKVLGDYRQFAGVLAERFPGRPLFLFGHSAGAALALEIASQVRSPLAGLVLVNPAYKLVYSKGMGPSVGDYFAYAANFLFRPSALTVDMNSNPAAVQNEDDRAEAEAMQRDPLVVRYFSMRYLFAEREVMNRCPKNAAAMTAPLLLVEGARDALVDPKGSEEILAAAATSDKQRLVAQEGGHGSTAVESVVAPLLDWLSRHASEPIER